MQTRIRSCPNAARASERTAFIDKNENPTTNADTMIDEPLQSDLPSKMTMPCTSRTSNLGSVPLGG